MNGRPLSIGNLHSSSSISINVFASFSRLASYAVCEISVASGPNAASAFFRIVIGRLGAFGLRMAILRFSGKASLLRAAMPTITALVTPKALAISRAVLSSPHMAEAFSRSTR